MRDYTEESNYTGASAITRMVWNMGDSDYSTWATMRSAMAYHEDESNTFSKTNIRRCAELLLEGTYPVFDVGTQLNIYVKKWGDWDAFILSWATAQAALADYERAEDEADMAEILKDSFYFEAVKGETVDAFNERLWLYEVKHMMDILAGDFDELAERLTVARTMLLARTGKSAA